MFKRVLFATLTFLAAWPALGQFDPRQAAGLDLQGLLANPGFESGLAAWTKSGSSTLTHTTTAANVAYGLGSAAWDASAAAETLTATAVSVPPALYGAECKATFYAKGGDSGIVAEVRDSAPANLATAVLGTTSGFQRYDIPFTCPSSSTVTFRLLSTADAAVVYLDQVLVSGRLLDNAEINLIGSPSRAGGWSETGTRFNDNPRTTYTAGDLPLAGAVPTALQMVSSTTVAGDETTDYVSYAFTTPATLGAKLKVEFYMRPGSNFVASEWTVSVWDTAGPTRQALSTDSSSLTYLPSATGKFTTTFDAVASTSYTLRFTRYVAGAASAATLNIANVIVGPGIQPQGAAVGGWQSYTPSIKGAVSDPTLPSSYTMNARWRRVGTNMEIRVEYLNSSNSGATAGSGGYYFTLPSGYTVDSAAISTSTAGNVIIGSAVLQDLNSGKTYYGVVSNYYGGLSMMGTSDAASVLWSSTAGSGALNTASGIRIGMEATIPIAKWAGSGTVNVAQNDVEYAYNTSGTTTAGASDSTSFGYGPAGVAIGSIASTTANSNTTMRVRFQTPVKTHDAVVMEIDSEATGQWIDAGLRGLGYVIQNTSRYGVRVLPVSGSVTDFDVTFGNMGSIATGATFGLAGTAWSGLATARWRVKKVSGGQAVGFGNVGQSTAGLVKSAGQLLGTNTNDSAATGYVGEYISTSTTATASTSGAYVTAASLVLTAGDWDVSGSVQLINSITTASNSQFAVIMSTAADTSSTGQTSAFSLLIAKPSVGVDAVLTFPQIRATCDGTNIYLHRGGSTETVAGTTLALRAYTGIFTVGTATIDGFISARRVR